MVNSSRGVCAASIANVDDTLLNTVARTAISYASVDSMLVVQTAAG